jgi:uncharacterized membrane protein YkvA (DUF1232 family)
MAALEKLRSAGRKIKQELNIYRLVMTDRRTPKLAKILLGAAVAYAISPIDIIPDFIPVVGHLDDIIIVPALVFIGLKLVPKKVVAECRAQVEGSIAPDLTKH